MLKRLTRGLKLEIALDAEPQTYATHYGGQLLGGQTSQGPHQAHSRHRDNALCIKCTTLEETSWYGHFESGWLEDLWCGGLL